MGVTSLDVATGFGGGEGGIANGPHSKR